MVKRKNIHFFLKSLLALMFVMVVFLLLPNSVIRAQQTTENQRQTLIAQIAQQITQLQQLLTQLLDQQQANPGIPIRLTISKINVDAAIELVGITPEGAVGAPKGPTGVAWFNLGPRPGDNGSAIITGHYGTWKNGQGSVFDNLNKLIPGDKISVEDLPAQAGEKGVTTNFVVRELRTYGQHESAPGVFNSVDGKAQHNLITCEGTWIAAQKTYSNRLVVFTDKE